MNATLFRVARTELLIITFYVKAYVYFYLHFAHLSPDFGKIRYGMSPCSATHQFRLSRKSLQWRPTLNFGS